MNRYLALLLSTTWPAATLAQTAPAPDAAALPADDTVVVTATRTPTDLDRVAASITVLDKAAIDRAQDVTIADLIVRTPGIALARNGGLGTATSIRIRGAESDQTVVVIDGVKLNDPALVGGGYNFANLLTGDATRVEVLRGPQSILWGSQAIGGVVNVVTALPDRAFEGSIDAEAGSRETVNARAGIGGRGERLTWRVAAQALTTDGISTISPRFGGVERDGFTNAGGSARAELRLVDGVTADLRGYYTRSRSDFDSSFLVPPDTDELTRNEEWIGYAGLNIDLANGRFRNRLAYTRTKIDRQDENPARTIRATTFDSTGRNRRLEYQGSVAIAPGYDLVVGLEDERSRFRSASPANNSAPVMFADRSVRISSAYGQLTATPVQTLTLSGGVRHDDHATFGGETTFGAGATWLPFGQATVLRASYGEGFKAPTLYQLYSPFGNLALTPERARGWDVGIEQQVLGSRVSIAATYFERRTRDLVTFASCPFSGALPPVCIEPGTTTPRFGYYDNIALAKARGVEAVLAAHVGALTMDANYSWIESEDRSPGVNFGNQLARRPRHSANGAISYVWPFGLTTGVALRYAGRTFDSNRFSATFAPAVIDDYVVVDLRAELPVAATLTLYGRVENLFDEDYETASRYGTLGRGVHAGLRARF